MYQKFYRIGWVAPGFLSLFLGLSVGCTERAASDGWAFGAEAREVPDAAQIVDARDGPGDTGTAAPRGDSAGSAEESSDDTGRYRQVDATGWLLSGSERREFISQESVHPRGSFEEGRCRVDIHNPLRDRERWWVSGHPGAAFETLRPYRAGVDELPQTGSAHMGFYEMHGRLSPEGSYGPRSEYDREFAPDEAELDVCRSVSQLGHCVRPRLEGPHCVVTDRSEHGRNEEERPFRDVELTRDAPDAKGSVYELTLATPSPERTVIELRFAHGPGPVRDPFVPVDQLTGTSLQVRWNETWSPQIEYRDVGGWVGLVQRARRETLYVSIAGTDPERPRENVETPDRLHVWGAFLVDASG